MHGQDIKGKLLEVRDFCLFGPLLVHKYTKHYLLFISIQTHSRHSINISEKESWILPGRQASSRSLSKNCPRHISLCLCEAGFQKGHTNRDFPGGPFVKILHFQSKKLGLHPLLGTKIPYAMQHATIHPRKQTNNRKSHTGQYRHPANGQPQGQRQGTGFKPQGTEAQTYSGTDEKPQVQPKSLVR